MRRWRQTFIFSYILEGKCEAGVFALDDAHFAKGSFAYDAQQPEVVEVHCGVGSDSFSRRHHERGRCRSNAAGAMTPACSTCNSNSELRTRNYTPWSVKTTGLPLLWPMAGYNWEWVRVSLIMHPVRRAGRGCGRGHKGCLGRGCGGQVERTAAKAGLRGGTGLFKFLNTTVGRGTAIHNALAGLRQRAGVARRALKGGRQF